MEILTPGCPVILEKGKGERKTPYTLVGAYYKNKVIPLYSSRANHLARELVIPHLFPEAREVKAEVQAEGSRFDYYIRTPDKEIYLEVKACTLVEEGVAMFPDAPSQRASRHLQELGNLPEGWEGHSLFVINHEDARVFRPNLHTDPLLAQTMDQVKDKVTFHGVSIRTSPQGEAEVVNPAVPIDWTSWPGIQNQGVYLFLLKIEAEQSVSIGRLGERKLAPGFYLYCGSAKANLSQRVERHKRKRKNKHWHLDYLRGYAQEVQAFPIQTHNDLECQLSEDVKSLSQGSITGFGSSDCNCSSHLHYFPEDPRKDRDFLDLLFHYRHVRAFD